MPSTLELCEKYFGTRDIYKLMNLTKKASEKDVKKAYYRLSLQVHPDRVAENEKEVSTEKFKVLTKIQGVLGDAEKKKLYDEQGIIDDDIDSEIDWQKLWREYFKPITTADIDNFQQKYKGSEEEEHEIRQAYLKGKGCINYMMSCVPCMEVDDEPRIIELVKGWIASGEVEEYKIFTKEPKAKRDKRHKKYGREKREAEEIKREIEKKNENKDSLEQQLLKRQSERAASASNFFDHLMAKYGDADDSDELVIPKKKKSASTKKSSAKVNAKGPAKSNAKTSLNKVKSGRVTKKK